MSYFNMIWRSSMWLLRIRRVGLNAPRSIVVHRRRKNIHHQQIDHRAAAVDHTTRHGIAIAGMADTHLAANRDFDLAVNHVTHLIVQMAVFLNQRLAFQKKLTYHRFVGGRHRAAVNANRHLYLIAVFRCYKVAIGL